MFCKLFSFLFDSWMECSPYEECDRDDLSNGPAKRPENSSCLRRSINVESVVQDADWCPAESDYCAPKTISLTVIRRDLRDKTI